MILQPMNNTSVKLPIRSIGLYATYNLCSTQAQFRRHQAEEATTFCNSTYRMLNHNQKIKNEMLFVKTENKSLKAVQQRSFITPTIE